MNLIWRKFWGFVMASFTKRIKPVMPVPSAPDQGKRAAEARRALRRSQVLLDKVESREQDVDTLHRSLRDLGEQNGFASLILRSLGGGTR